MAIERFHKFKTNEFYPKSMGRPEHHIANDFCMVVRAGNNVYMRGQTGFDFDGKFHGLDDVAAQTENACQCIEKLLEDVGGSVKNICKITVYITDRNFRHKVYGVIANHFKDVYPCSTGLVVDGLALPEMLVEIDVDAYIDEEI